jgi:hypothetical protein
MTGERMQRNVHNVNQKDAGPEEDLESGSKEMLDFVQNDIERDRTTRNIPFN